MRLEINTYQILGLILTFGLALLISWSRGYKEGKRVGYFQGRSVKWHSQNKDVTK